jgi:splicing factor 1
MTDGELRGMLTPYGTVKSVYIVKDGITGLSCGYAFVRMTDGPHAARAVSELNGKRIDGHFLIVRPLF